MQPLSLFGPIDAVLGSGDNPLILYVLLILVIVNIVTRAIAHRSNVSDAREQGADAIGQHPAHVASTILLILASFYLTTVEVHSGIVLSVLVVGMFITDFFELEALRVEARNDRNLSRPNGAIAASVLVLLYAAFLSVFFVVAPVWNAVV
ncbi:DUF7313 family protein [Halococcus salifodinae]|uniref:DUF7313 domain-containing protein n=1 Tax=Halococcus salifodinae DSM 8989 TaxID=1227456 RepID=M0MZT6_9EURY|nr:hypothetical protein [Halococcus salifodinae]EMA50808.1 hypothetical protein C450_14067 [Halococcus salifodinae DSM 8989]